MKPLSDYGLSAPPFLVSPTKKYARIWVGRKETKAKLDDFFESMSGNSASEILLIWGYYGTGKTHALLHYSQKLLESGEAVLIFTDLTRCSPKGFLGLSKEFMIQLDPDILMKAVRELGVNADSPQDLRKLRRITEIYDIEILKAISSASDEDKIYEVMLWLQGENCDKKKIGVRRKIHDDSKALSAICSVIKVLQQKYRFVGWLLDEYGTLRTLMASKRGLAFKRMEKGLVNLYNTCSIGFILAFSFSSRQRDVIYEMIPEQLRQRIASVDQQYESSTVTFPVMTMEESTDFVKGLLGEFQTNPKMGKFYPFTRECVRYILKKDVVGKEKDLVPRWINVAHKRALEAAQRADISAPLTIDEVEKAFAQRNV